jgi:hypothetical protein
MNGGPEPGVCRHCGCRGDCRLRDGESCCWLAAERMACSAPHCWMAEKRRLQEGQLQKREERNAAARKHGDRFKGMGYGQIVMEMRREARNQARRRRKARGI